MAKRESMSLRSDPAGWRCHPKEDAQYEAFKRKNEEAKALQRTFGKIKHTIRVSAARAVWARSTVATNLAAALASRERRSVYLMRTSRARHTKDARARREEGQGLETAEPKGEMLDPLEGRWASSHVIVLLAPVQRPGHRLERADEDGPHKEFFMHVYWGEARLSDNRPSRAER